MTLLTFPAADPTINPTTASFDKNPAQQSDVSTTLTTNGYTLTSVEFSGSPISTSFYTLSGSTLTIKKEFLSAQSTGSTDLILKFDSGTQQEFKITVTDTTPPIPPAPSTPMLSTADDTGASASDGITMQKQPTFAGTAAANSTVYLFDDLNSDGIFDNGEGLGQGIATSSGDWVIKSSLLIDGDHNIRAVASNSPGQYSVASGVKVVTIDTADLVVNSLAVPANATYSAGDNLDFTLNLSRAVDVSTINGTPYLSLDIGGKVVKAYYVSGNGTDALTFRYTVLKGDLDLNGITIYALVLINPQQIQTVAGKKLDTTLNSVGSTAGILVADNTRTLNEFEFAGLTSAAIGVVNETEKTVNVVVPYGTDVTKLVPTIVYDGQSISPIDGMATDFSSPVDYNVYAESGASATYTVTVTVAQSPSKQALGFQFVALSPIVNGVINEEDKTITATVPYGTDLTALVPAFLHSGASVSPANGTPQNFTSPIDYTVTALDGSKVIYTVTVKTEEPSNNALLEGLQVSAGQLDPEFSPNEKNYKASVDYKISELKVTPQVQNSGATVRVNDILVTEASGVPVKLNVGSNKITVKVSAQDEVTLETYTLDVTRAEEPKPTNPPTPTPAPGGSGNGSSFILTPAPLNPTERIEVNIDLGGSNRVVTKTIVERTKTAQGAIDSVTLSPTQAKEAVDQAAASEESTVRIILPDVLDEVIRTHMKLPVSSLQEMAARSKNLEIVARDVQIAIPSNSLSGVSQELYFNIVAIKDADKRAEALRRVTGENLVREASSRAGLTPSLIGRPIEIDTNLQNQKVTLRMPIPSAELPSNPIQQQAFLNSLAIYIEHSDQDRELLRGKIVKYDDVKVGLEFDVDKFSTFTILSWKGGNLQELISSIDGGGTSSENPASTEGNSAYIQGYADGTFRPNASVTRAQLAVMVAALLGYDKTAFVDNSGFSDVAYTHWAAGAIAYVNQSGYLIGDAQGKFRPNAAVTRAEMAAIASRLKGLQNDGSTNASFSDVPSGHWASSAIQSARQASLITGYADGMYRPSQTMTRAEAVTVLNRVFDRSPITSSVKSSWIDVSPSYWAFGNIEAASSQ
nr:S-layer homology domain-containing protein [Saccharibacillus sp. JS10]